MPRPARPWAGAQCTGHPGRSRTLLCWALSLMGLGSLAVEMSFLSTTLEVTELMQWRRGSVLCVSEQFTEQCSGPNQTQEGLPHLPAPLARGFQELGVQGNGPAHLPLCQRLSSPCLPLCFLNTPGCSREAMQKMFSLKKARLLAKLKSH